MHHQHLKNLTKNKKDGPYPITNIIEGLWGKQNQTNFMKRKLTQNRKEYHETS